MQQRILRFWTKLLKFFCNDSFYEELQGDLEEAFHANTEAKGLKKAKSIYRKEVIKLIRPSVMKSMKTNRHMNNLALFKIHWLLSVRNLKKNRVFSLVTTLGFAAAISISLFLINMIYSGYSIDKQHPEVDRIYRVATNSNFQGERKIFASTPFSLKEKIDNEVPGFELLTHVNRTLAASFKINDSDIMLNGIYVDQSFFEIFSFSSIYGNTNDLFLDQNSIIITQEIAQKIYPNQNPIGQITEEGLVVRAVIESPKNKSHIPFEAIANITTFKRLSEWEYRDRNYIYGRVLPSTKLGKLDERLTELANNIKTELPTIDQSQSYFLQSINGIIFQDGVFNEIGSSIGREGLIIFSSLTLLLISMACFNYTNLSMARALQRTKEVGIRKVAGSTKRQIISQFLIETSLFSSLGFLVGLGIYAYFSSRIAEFIPFPFQEISNYRIILVFISFAVMMGFSAGIIPSLFFAKISPLALFRKQASNGKLSFQGIRKLLVGLQLTISMFCIIFLSMIIDQNSIMRNTPVGVKTDQLLIVNSNPETVALLSQEFSKISGVVSSTVVSSLPVADFPRLISVYGDNIADSVTTRYFRVDANFDDVFEPELKLGSFFSSKTGQQDFLEVVVTEALLNKLEIPYESALGTILSQKDERFQIVGVLDQPIAANPLIKQDDALMLINSNERLAFGRLILKLEGSNLEGTLSQIESTWENFHATDNFQSSFLKTQIDSTYRDLMNAIRIIGFIGGCIILIAILGQLGMALFNAESKVKEIGIRKVMGATIQVIIGLILKNTLITMLISTLIAAPLAYIVFIISINNEVRTPLPVGPWVLLKGALLLALIVLGVVISQTWRVARLNPAESLKSE
jgi:ABC-type antimicrobial peptide transport system permease subunit